MNLACESLESIFSSKISKSPGPPDSTDPSDLPNQSDPKNVVFINKALMGPLKSEKLPLDVALHQIFSSSA